MGGRCAAITANEKNAEPFRAVRAVIYYEAPPVKGVLIALS